ncbi:MAG: RNA 3'-terminal phosphate cyclase [Desulfuromonadales bacterium]
MIVIDGSQGEGGGQILRTALALSLVTRRAFRINNIRAGRRKPGLMRQHLSAVNAAVKVGEAEVEGNALDSQQLVFKPRTIRAGSYRFSIGSAGSCTLVLQTVLPALMLADGASDLVLEGGTHNPHAPPFDFLDRAFLPLLQRMGPRLSVHLEKPGFHPAGGGRFNARIEPVSRLRNLDLPERGPALACHATASVTRLPVHIAERELSVLRREFGWDESALQIEEITNSAGPGNVLTVAVESEHVTELFTGFGERGVKAEKVAGRTAAEVREYLEAGAPVGRHLADQLLLPMALAGGGSFRTLSPSRHMMTNIDVLKRFLDIKLDVRRCDERTWEVQVKGGKS